mmetsp:Transcript_44547/g.88272  ORF Transcript_44547/g.88272 Transcript_44547/m.88272 type:complete len:524 (+) Transcript_44547:94-1665(+)
MAGIQFPATEKGDRSTTAFGKSVFGSAAQSLGRGDVAEAIKKEKDWRHQYVKHLDALTDQLCVTATQDAEKVAQALRSGLEQARAMEFESAEGTTLRLAEAMAAMPKKFETVKVEGTGTPMLELSLPYAGKHLTGQELSNQVDHWAKRGTMEPDSAEAVKIGAQRLGDLRGRTFLVLGAGSELGPVRPLLQAGATVAAVATRRPGRWGELLAFARSTAGTLLVPVASAQAVANDNELAQVAGADLITETPSIAEWFLRCGREAVGAVTCGTYLYADGEANVRLTVASDFVVDTLAQALGNQKVSFAYLVSPSTSVVIPPEAVQAQETNFTIAGRWSKLFGQRLECPTLPGVTPPLHIFHGLVVLQGPNYALAQMMRQWRAVLLHMGGFVVSTPVAPTCRTESVVHNKTMSAILDGMGHWHPMESFNPDTARMAMFAILVSELTEQQPPKLASPMHIFARKAFHSGGWRCPFDLSSLGASTWVLGRLAPAKHPGRHVNQVKLPHQRRWRQCLQQQQQQQQQNST